MPDPYGTIANVFVMKGGIVVKSREEKVGGAENANRLDKDFLDLRRVVRLHE